MEVAHSRLTTTVIMRLDITICPGCGAILHPHEQDVELPPIWHCACGYESPDFGIPTIRQLLDEDWGDGWNNVNLSKFLRALFNEQMG